MTPPKAQKEHEWLQQLVGNWTSEMDDPQSGQKIKGKEAVRSLGDLWIVQEMTGGMAGPQSEDVSLLTLGFDPEKKRFIGTFVSSSMTHLWLYDGVLEGDKLTLTSEGPSMTGEGMATYRDVIDMTGGKRTFLSYGQDDKGEWQQFMNATYKRA